MTQDQLKDLEDRLWESANSLRAYGGIKSADYALPVLGLIFLRFADSQYSRYEADIKAKFELQKSGRGVPRPIEKVAVGICGFYLPEASRYDYLLHLPEEKSAAEAIEKAIKGITQHLKAEYQDILPTQRYFDIEKKKRDILPQLLKAFSDIPPDASGDLFGKIYEYFLGKFALSEGQKGGQFFTPTSVVRFIVEVIEPYQGKLFDPACGSGGDVCTIGHFYSGGE
ncbi:MAG: N-6 DNA methylase [Bacteroidota bacterium]